MHRRSMSLLPDMAKLRCRLSPGGALHCALVGGMLALSQFHGHSEEAAAPSVEQIKAAVQKSIPLLENGARVSKEERERCFTCHNQGMPVMALTIARDRGFSIDAETTWDQVQFTADFLAKNRANYLEGRGQGGQVDTAGFALWALANGAWKPDETTAAVAEFLLRFQSDQPHWKPQSQRPPTEQSPFTSTHVALRGLKAFGTPAQQERIARRVE